MYLRNVSKWIFITGTLLIWLVKFIIRPFVNVPSYIKPFLGISPNLLGSFLLPFGACLLLHRVFKIETAKDLAYTCSFGLLLVIINEYLQLIPIFGRTFDYLDIFSSVIGVFFGHYVFAKLLMSRTPAIKGVENPLPLLGKG